MSDPQIVGGGVLKIGEELKSPKGSTTLTFHEDGEFAGTLRLYVEDECIWTPDTEARNAATLELDNDGLLVLKDADQNELWTNKDSLINSNTIETPAFTNGTASEAASLVLLDVENIFDPASVFASVLKDYSLIWKGHNNRECETLNFRGSGLQPYEAMFTDEYGKNEKSVKKNCSGLSSINMAEALRTDGRTRVRAKFKDGRLSVRVFEARLNGVTEDFSF